MAGKTAGSANPVRLEAKESGSAELKEALQSLWGFTPRQRYRDPVPSVPFSQLLSLLKTSRRQTLGEGVHQLVSMGGRQRRARAGMSFMAPWEHLAVKVDDGPGGYGGP